MKKKPSPPSNTKPRQGTVSHAQYRLLLLVLNTTALACLYFVLASHGFPYISFVYLLGGGALAIWYVIYNRGFNTRGKTADMLPDEFPLAERERLIEEGKQRMQKSRWALLILLPILITLLLDMAYLFLIPEGLFS